jgi:integrase
VWHADWFAQWSARKVWTHGTLLAGRQPAESVTFAAVRVRDLRASHVVAWVTSMDTRGLEASTIRTRFTYVRTALKAAVRDRVIPEDPSAGVDLPKVRRREHAMAVPSSEQVGRAVEAAPPWFAPFVAVCAFAGLRLGEAAGLQLDDVDFLRRTIAVGRQIKGETWTTTRVVPPKAGSERVVNVPEDLMTMLAQHVEHLGTLGAEQWLMRSPDGHVYRRSSAGTQWRNVRREVGMEGFTLALPAALLRLGPDRGRVRRRHGAAGDGALKPDDHTERLQSPLADRRGPDPVRGRRPHAGGSRGCRGP